MNATVAALLDQISDNFRAEYEDDRLVKFAITNPEYFANSLREHLNTQLSKHVELNGWTSHVDLKVVPTSSEESRLTLAISYTPPIAKTHVSAPRFSALEANDEGQTRAQALAAHQREVQELYHTIQRLRQNSGLSRADIERHARIALDNIDDLG